MTDLLDILLFQAITQHELHFKQMPSQCNVKDFSTIEHPSISVIDGGMITFKGVQDTLTKHFFFFKAILEFFKYISE